jgi:hypothetical protein
VRSDREQRNGYAAKDGTKTGEIKQMMPDKACAARDVPTRIEHQSRSDAMDKRRDAQMLINLGGRDSTEVAAEERTATSQAISIPPLCRLGLKQRSRAQDVTDKTGWEALDLGKKAEREVPIRSSSRG